VGFVVVLVEYCWVMGGVYIWLFLCFDCWGGGDVWVGGGVVNIF
jgi:hypothetical protein